MRRLGESYSERDRRKLRGERKKAERKKAAKKFVKKVQKNVKKGTEKVKTTVKKGTEKVKTTSKKIATGVVKGAKSPVGKLGLPVAALTTAYYVADQFRSDKRSKTRGERAGKKGPQFKSPKPETSIVKKTKGPKVSDIMGGAQGPKGPLGGAIDKVKSQPKVKKKEIDLRKTNLAGVRMGQRRDGGLTKINPEKQPGLAALKKERPDVVAKMGYAKNGTMVQARGCGKARKKPTRIT